jgi:hypothetical protein
MRYRASAPRTIPQRARRSPIVLRRGLHDFAVAVWREDADGVPVYEVVEEDIRERPVAAAVARQKKPPAGKRTR